MFPLYGPFPNVNSVVSESGRSCYCFFGGQWLTMLWAFVHSFEVLLIPCHLNRHKCLETSDAKTTTTLEAASQFQKNNKLQTPSETNPSTSKPKPNRKTWPVFLSTFPKTRETPATQKSSGVAQPARSGVVGWGLRGGVFAVGRFMFCHFCVMLYLFCLMMFNGLRAFFCLKKVLGPALISLLVGSTVVFERFSCGLLLHGAILKAAAYDHLFSL